MTVFLLAKKKMPNKSFLSYALRDIVKETLLKMLQMPVNFLKKKVVKTTEPIHSFGFRNGILYSIHILQFAD